MLNLKKGDTYIPNKFLSSGEQYKTAQQFATKPGKSKVIMTIKSKNGKEIQDISFYDYEKEVLFDSKTKFLVEEITKKQTNNGLWIIDMVILEL